MTKPAKTARKKRAKAKAKAKLPLPSSDRLEPLLHSVPETADLMCCGITKVYELIARGELEAKKLGDRTVISRVSILRLIERLPRFKGAQ
jgi:hypothetical protein